jgi:hypothetical protein
VRVITPARISGPVRFFLAAMTMDMVGTPHGQRRLAAYFRELVKEQDGAA